MLKHKFIFLIKRKISYSKNLIKHFEKPRNVGSLDKKDLSVGTGLVGAPACGDVMKLQIKVNNEGKIIDTKFKTFGCGSAIAASSVASELLKNKSIEEALKIIELKENRNYSTKLPKKDFHPPIKNIAFLMN